MEMESVVLMRLQSPEAAEAAQCDCCMRVHDERQQEAAMEAIEVGQLVSNQYSTHGLCILQSIRWSVSITPSNLFLPSYPQDQLHLSDIYLLNFCSILNMSYGAVILSILS